MLGSLCSVEYLFQFLGGGIVGCFWEVTVYVGGRAGSRVTRSTCNRYDRNSCGDLHSDVRVPKAVDGSFFKSCRLTYPFHPRVYCVGVNISTVLHNYRSFLEVAFNRFVQDRCE